MLHAACRTPLCMACCVLQCCTLHCCKDMLHATAMLSVLRVACCRLHDIYFVQVATLSVAMLFVACFTLLNVRCMPSVLRGVRCALQCYISVVPAACRLLHPSVVRFACCMLLVEVPCCNVATCFGMLHAAVLPIACRLVFTLLLRACSVCVCCVSHAARCIRSVAHGEFLFASCLFACCIVCCMLSGLQVACCLLQCGLLCGSQDACFHVACDMLQFWTLSVLHVARLWLAASCACSVLGRLRVACCRLQRCRLHLARFCTRCLLHVVCCTLQCCALHVSRCCCVLHVSRCCCMLPAACFVVQVACCPLHLAAVLFCSLPVVGLFSGLHVSSCCSVRVAWCALHVACCARLLHIASFELHGTCSGSHVAYIVVACFAGVLRRTARALRMVVVAGCNNCRTLRTGSVARMHVARCIFRSARCMAWLVRASAAAPTDGSASAHARRLSQIYGNGNRPASPNPRLRPACAHPHTPTRPHRRPPAAVTNTRANARIRAALFGARARARHICIYTYR
jgi:hypothetical protein